jgi:hypothetical protein
VNQFALLLARQISAMVGIVLGLVLIPDLRLSAALVTGAMGMILSRVLTIQEAY